MQGPIPDRLDDLLHAQFAALRAPEDVEPAAGFYARVLQRIEERESRSIPSLFIDSPFSKRLALASLTIAVALGSYVVSQERRERPATPQTVLALNNGAHYDAPVTGSESERRDAVLLNFAMHQAAASQGQVQ